jgi:hypothetical protein
MGSGCRQKVNGTPERPAYLGRLSVCRQTAQPEDSSSGAVFACVSDFARLTHTTARTSRRSRHRPCCRTRRRNRTARSPPLPRPRNTGSRPVPKAAPRKPRSRPDGALREEVRPSHYLKAQAIGQFIANRYASLDPPPGRRGRARLCRVSFQRTPDLPAAGRVGQPGRHLRLSGAQSTAVSCGQGPCHRSP